MGRFLRHVSLWFGGKKSPKKDDLVDLCQRKQKKNAGKKTKKKKLQHTHKMLLKTKNTNWSTSDYARRFCNLILKKKKNGEERPSAQWGHVYTSLKAKIYNIGLQNWPSKHTSLQSMQRQTNPQPLYQQAQTTGQREKLRYYVIIFYSLHLGGSHSVRYIAMFLKILGASFHSINMWPLIRGGHFTCCLCLFVHGLSEVLWVFYILVCVCACAHACVWPAKAGPTPDVCSQDIWVFPAAHSLVRGERWWLTEREEGQALCPDYNHLHPYILQLGFGLKIGCNIAAETRGLGGHWVQLMAHIYLLPVLFL